MSQFFFCLHFYSTCYDALMRLVILCYFTSNAVYHSMLTLGFVHRVSGRSTHVAKLRMEFDSGADYDMGECGPGEIDPHAVASIFKAYLRECLSFLSIMYS